MFVGISELSVVSGRNHAEICQPAAASLLFFLSTGAIDRVSPASIIKGKNERLQKTSRKKRLTSPAFWRAKNRFTSGFLIIYSSKTSLKSEV